MLHVKSVFLVLALSVLTIAVHAQETKKISRKVKFNLYILKETFEVLTSDPEVKHGNYSASFAGYSEKGHYDHGKKTGIWECYDRSKLAHKYDFNTSLFSEDTPPKMIVKIWQLDELGAVIKELPIRNIYLGGDAKMISVLVQSIRYPAPAVQNRTQGKVHVTATLSKEGIVSGEKAETNFGDGLEEEAIRVFKLLPPDWVPVIENGQPVPVKIEYTVNFILS